MISTLPNDPGSLFARLETSIGRRPSFKEKFLLSDSDVAFFPLS
jgi:hypothetical protein